MREAALCVVWLFAIAVLVRAILHQCDAADRAEAELENRRRNWSP